MESSSSEDFILWISIFEMLWISRFVHDGGPLGHVRGCEPRNPHAENLGGVSMKIYY